jgi:hypothetical protein
MWLATPIVILVASLPAAAIACWLRCRPVYVGGLVGSVLGWLFLRPLVAARFHDPLDALLTYARLDFEGAIPGMMAGALIGLIIWRRRIISHTLPAGDDAGREMHSSANADSTTS